MFDADFGLLQLIEEGETYVLLIPVYVALLGGERFAHLLWGRRVWDDRDALANTTITVAFLVVEVLVGALVPLGLFALLHDQLGLFSLGFGVGGWVVAFLLRDLAWYVDHRIGHRVGLFWSMHHVHHSSQSYNMTVASRGFLLDATLLSRPTMYLLAIVGLTPLHFVAVTIVTNIWGIAQHTALVGKLGRLEWVLATPSNHRVHHGSDDEYIDRNYGEVLIVWDLLLGTYRPEGAEPTYGVKTPIDTYNPLQIQVAGLRWLGAKMRRASGLPDKLRCLVMPPEWEPSSAASVQATGPTGS